MSWRVGSRTKVTLFKGEEIYGILLDPEKAAVVVANLNFVERCATGGELRPEMFSDAALEKAFDAFLFEMVRRGRRGAGAPGGAPEGGAEGHHPAAGADGVRGAEGVLGAGHGGDCAPGGNCCGAGEWLRAGGAVG